MRLERAHLEEFESRHLNMPDGSPRDIDIPRLYWHWFDRMHALRGQHFYDRLFCGRLEEEAKRMGVSHDVALMRTLEAVVRDELESGNDPFDAPFERFERRKAHRAFRERFEKDN